MINAVRPMAEVALGDAALSTCPVGEHNSDGEITIDDLIVAVQNVLSGCPAPPAFAIRGGVTEFAGCVGYMRGVTVILDPLGLMTQTEIGPDPGVAGTFAFEDIPPATTP